MEGERNPVDRCHEIIAEGALFEFSPRFESRTHILKIGGCEIEAGYSGPELPSKDGKHYMTEEFIDQMIQWFKEGKNLAKRYAWEIVFGAYEIFSKEDSLVTVSIPEGVTVDVIGDVHGQPQTFIFFRTSAHCLHLSSRPILRRAALAIIDRQTQQQTLSAIQRRPCGQRIVVY